MFLLGFLVEKEFFLFSRVCKIVIVNEFFLFFYLFGILNVSVMLVFGDFVVCC